LLDGICVPRLSKREKIWFHFGTTKAEEKIHYSEMLKATTDLLRETDELPHPLETEKEFRRVEVLDDVFVSAAQLLLLEKACAIFHTEEFEDNAMHVGGATV
jgi:hypothetical protein